MEHCTVRYLAEVFGRCQGEIIEEWHVQASELWPLVQRLLLDLRSVASNHQIQVLNEIPPRLTVWADAGLISQVFQNLLGNAFKYAEGGQIVVSAHDDDGCVTCLVRDNGAGIPPDLLPNVFDKLTTDPDKDGRGLGLAIVKQIVEAHGGAATVESTHGEGAAFHFTLPPNPEELKTHAPVAAQFSIS
jgi:signal transduction histidine kinase